MNKREASKTPKVLSRTLKWAGIDDKYWIFGEKSLLEWEVMSATLGLKGWQHIQAEMTRPEGRNIRLEPKASEDMAVMWMG